VGFLLGGWSFVTRSAHPLPLEPYRHRGFLEVGLEFQHLLENLHVDTGLVTVFTVLAIRNWRRPKNWVNVFLAGGVLPGVLLRCLAK